MGAFSFDATAPGDTGRKQYGFTMSDNMALVGNDVKPQGGEMPDDATATGATESQATEAAAEQAATTPEESGTETSRVSLFGDEKGFSEEELAGEVENEAAKAQEAAAGEPGGKETEAAKPEDKPGDDRKPPEGFVPKEALTEERGKRQMLARQLEDLQRQLEGRGQQERPQAGPAESKLPADFKVKTPDEYNALVEEDIVEAQKYLMNLMIYQEEQKAMSEQKDQATRLIQSRFDEMAAAVPGLFDEGSTVNDEMTQFAKDCGMDDEFISMLTDPRTVIVQDGKQYLLGRGAVGVTKLIYNAMQKVKGINPEEIRKQVEKEVMQKTAEQVVGKIKNTNDGYRSLGSVPGSGEQGATDLSDRAVITEAEMARLTPAERERLLGGGP